MISLWKTSVGPKEISWAYIMVYGGFPQMGVPLFIIHFFIGSSDINQPLSGAPMYWNPHINVPSLSESLILEQKLPFIDSITGGFQRTSMTHATPNCHTKITTSWHSVGDVFGASNKAKCSPWQLSNLKSTQLVSTKSVPNLAQSETICSIPRNKA